MLNGWIPYSEELIEKYTLTKVVSVVPGGATGQESIYHGIEKAKEHYKDNPCVLIHDGVRPIIDTDTIEKCIDTVYKYGNAITVAPASETVALTGTEESVGEILPRQKCLMVKAPQCFLLNDIYNCHILAQKEKKDDFIDSASLMQFYGYKLHTIEGRTDNIKITTPSDFYIFRAIVDAQENQQIFG